MHLTCLSSRLWHISECIKQDVLTNMHKSSGISIMIDESTSVCMVVHLLMEN